jgi:YebC/PmpR family DNA-binding regulatory protein
MAGHSHWHNIKHHKAIADRKRAAITAKMGVLITVAVQMGGGPNPNDNPRLRLAMAKARSAEMNNEAIDRAIKKAAGQGVDGKQMAELAYEGYAPGGVAVVVDALTDNRNRTAPEIKKLFERCGGSIGAPGCVAWQFKPRAVFLVQGADADRTMEALLAAGADAIDIQPEEGGASIVAEVKDYDPILKALAAAKITVTRSDLTRLPETEVPVADPALAKQIQELLDALDDHPDVQDVVHNGLLPA